MEYAATLPLRQHVTDPTSWAAVDVYEPSYPTGPISALSVRVMAIELARVTLNVIAHNIFYIVLCDMWASVILLKCTTIAADERNNMTCQNV